MKGSVQTTNPDDYKREAPFEEFTSKPPNNH